MLRNQTLAPDFTLPDADGRPRSLADLRSGKPILLLFSRGGFCPTAQRDLVDYANVAGRIRGIGAEIAAISTSSAAECKRLQEALGVPFPLLTDADFSVAEAYGVYRSDDEEGPQPHGEPALFLLDIDGRIAYSQVCTGPKGLANPAEMALILLYMSQNGGKY